MSATAPAAATGSKADPYCLIQTAIDNAVDTDEIIVAPGHLLRVHQLARVWAAFTPGELWTWNLYAVDENGGWYDGDGDGIPD